MSDETTEERYDQVLEHLPRRRCGFMEAIDLWNTFGQNPTDELAVIATGTEDGIAGRAKFTGQENLTFPPWRGRVSLTVDRLGLIRGGELFWIVPLPRLPFPYRYDVRPGWSVVVNGIQKPFVRLE